MDINTTLNHFIPTLYCLNDLNKTNFCSFDNETGNFNFPMRLNLSVEMLQKQGIYLLDLGDSYILYLFKEAKKQDQDAIFIENNENNSIEWTEKMEIFLSELTRFLTI